MTTKTKRMARCPYCKTTAPSSERERLAFFEDRSAGRCNDTCRNCRYSKVAHGPNGNPRSVAGQSSHVCDRFEPLSEGYEYDTYYCGCRGWD